MKTVVIFLGNCIEVSFSIILDLVYAMIDMLRRNKGFNANFGRETMIASRFNKGFLISRHRRLSRRKSYESVLLVGPLGSGKSMRLLLKNLFLMKDCSFIVNDVSGELYRLASGYLQQHFTVKTLNFSDSTLSSGYNILSRARKPNDIDKIAHLLISTSLDKGNGDPYWRLVATKLLRVFLRLVFHQPPEYRTIANVSLCLTHFSVHPEKIDVLVARTRDPKLILDYKRILAIPEKALQSIITTVESALQLFDDPEIARVTSFDSIDIAELRRTPTVLFLRNSVADQDYISVLNRLFFEQLYGHLLRGEPEPDEKDLFILLDEASSLKIDLLASALNNLRKHRVGTFCCIQGINQLTTLYGDKARDVITGCGTRIHLPGETSVEVLRELEALSGKCTFKDDKGIERVKPLMTVDEIRRLPSNRTLILSGNTPIIKGRTSLYFKSFRFSRYARVPARPLVSDIPDNSPPLLT